jgi:CheY-like chemotaxis protein
MAPKRILVIDDDTVRGLGVQSTIGAFGYDVEVVQSGLAALEVAAATPPDLVLCDADMPEMDGCQFVRLLRESPELGAVPAFMIFDDDTAETRMEAFQAGADHCLSRPVKWDELRVRISRIFDSHTRVLARAVAVAPAPPIRRRSTTGFGGKLRQLGLPSVLSLLEMERRDGELRVVDNDNVQLGQIVFRNGHVVGAETGDADGPQDADAVFSLLDTSDGRFEFREGDAPPDARVSLRVQELLLEHARRTDESSKS